MRFIVSKIKQQEQRTLVTGSTSVGTLKGIWVSHGLPIIGEYYHVELNINCPTEQSIPSRKRPSPSVRLENDTVYFTGICEDMDEEVYCIRFAIDWLEMLLVEDIRSLKKVGDDITFSASIYDITLYPYTL